uniref:Peptidase S1 domain-containing protein n=1 Tax=Aquila chrysaetos chrysaetos TaxID=223781 RepID=A0A663EY16_AQUCH
EENPRWQATLPYSIPSVCQSPCGTKLFYPWLMAALLCWQFCRHIQVRMGEYNADVKEHSELVRSATLIIHHPRYDSRSLDNDIMLIKLATTMDYSADIQPTGLPSTRAKEGPKCLFQGEETPPVLSNQKCQEAYPGQITSNMICVRFLDGGKDSCQVSIDVGTEPWLMLLNFSLQGDSGGPAVCIGKPQGIVSQGTECALKGHLSVYTKVCNYID